MSTFLAVFACVLALGALSFLAVAFDRIEKLERQVFGTSPEDSEP